MQDRYDLEIERLARSPEDLRRTWLRGEGLFALCWRGSGQIPPTCGCLTIVKGRGDVVPGSAALTEAIRQDTRIPAKLSVAEFTAMSKPERRAFLQPFAEWQRRLDKELPALQKEYCDA